MSKIRIGIIGLGNCACSLIQGLHYYSNKTRSQIGLMHSTLGGYSVSDIEVVMAIDVDSRKVDKDISEAVFASPNCTKHFADVPYYGIKVCRGVTLDGIAKHTQKYDESIRVVESNIHEPSKEKLVEQIKKSGVEMLVNYLPVGSTKAVQFYAECALDSGVGEPLKKSL